MNEVTLADKVISLLDMFLWLIFPSGMMYAIFHVYLDDKKHEDHTKPRFKGDAKKAYPLKEESVKKAA